MSPRVQKLIGQAIIQLINGDKQKAAELSTKSHKMWFREHQQPSRKLLNTIYKERVQVMKIYEEGIMMKPNIK